MGRVFQDPLSGTAPNLTIAENLVARARQRGRRWLVLRWALTVVAPREACAERVRDAPAWDWRIVWTRRSARCRAGERQALTLLMATLVKPTLLLLDEHTAALDPRSVEQVVEADGAGGVEPGSPR